MCKLKVYIINSHQRETIYDKINIFRKICKATEVKNTSAVVDTTFVDIYVDTKNIPTCRYNINISTKEQWKIKCQ